jgi:hypothetical protein
MSRNSTWPSHRVAPGLDEHRIKRSVDLATVAELLGHSPKSGFAMTKRYVHLAISNLLNSTSGQVCGE